MKNQALFSSKDKSEKLKCNLLQFLFGALRVKVLTLFRPDTAFEYLGQIGLLIGVYIFCLQNCYENCSKMKTVTRNPNTRNILSEMIKMNKSAVQ